MQADDRAEWRVLPWAGTIDQLKRAAQQCQTRIANAAPYPPGYDPATSEQPSGETHEEWLDAEQARAVTIKVLEEDGFSRKLTLIEDLDDIGPEQLDRIEGIDIDVGGGGYRTPSAGITASKARGLAVSLVGPDRTWTAGLRHELEETLTVAGKTRPLPISAEVYFPLAGFLFPLTLFGLAFYLDTQTEWSNLIVLAISLAAAALVGGVTVAIGARLPAFELLRPGGKPSYERWRARIAGAVGTALLGIVVSIVAAQLSG